MADGELHKSFRTHLKGFDFQRIETGGIAQGVPDVNYCYNGSEGWIENKHTGGWKVEVRSEQVGWIERRFRHGGRVFVAVRQTGKDRGGPPRNVLWLLRWDAARMLFDGMRLDLLPASSVLVRSPGGPAAWDWETVRLFLLLSTR